MRLTLIRLTGPVRRMLRCEAGLASVEFTVIAASIGVALLMGAFHLAPKIHAYLLYVESTTALANATLATLPPATAP